MQLFTVASLLAALAVLAPRPAHGAPANIDTDGFLQDGSTTYCEGVSNTRAPLVFPDLLPSSAGDCPIHLTLSTQVRKSDATGATEVWVNWTAALAPPSDVESSLFPRVLDAETGAPRAVIASLLRACKVGSNCATDADVVVPAAMPGDGTTIGAFDAEGTKTLRGFVFGFAAGAVDHVLVAKVVLPGDAALNISATEFLTFQRIRLGESEAGAEGVAAVGGPVTPGVNVTRTARGPGTVHPSDSSGSAFVNDVAHSLEPELKPSTGVNATTLSTGGASKKGGATNIIVISVIAGLGFIMAIAYFVVARKDKKKNKNESGIYRLSDGIKQAPSMPYDEQQQQHAPRVFPEDDDGPMPARHYQPPHAQQQQHAVWKGKAPAGGLHHAQSHSIASSGWRAPTTELHDVDLTSFGSERSEVSLATGLTSFGSLHDSTLTLTNTNNTLMNSLHDSAITLHNSLHDSSVTLPRFQRRASSASSYADELDDSDQEYDGTEDGASSRLFTNYHMSEVLNHQRTTAVLTNRTDLSRLSWVESEADSEDGDDLAELTTVIHERYPPRKP